jgi:hypothetical protein
MKWNKFLKKPKEGTKTNKSEPIKQDYLQDKDTINTKRKNKFRYLKIFIDILIQQIYVFSSQINNLKNVVKPIAKQLTSNPKNEHENDHLLKD